MLCGFGLAVGYEGWREQVDCLCLPPGPVLEKSQLVAYGVIQPVIQKEG